MMQQALGEFEAALHASGECFCFFVGAIVKTDAAQHFIDALLQNGASESVEVADMGEVLGSGELNVNALRLEGAGLPV